MSLPVALSLDLRGRSLTRIRDWTAAELDAVLDLADELKAKQLEREPHRLLEGRTLGLLFRKHSTRTRISLEVAAAHLGATALYLPDEQLQLARGESIDDTARVLGRYLDALAIRTYEHAEVETFAAVAGVPVVNALTDEAHPLQALADLQTIRERFGKLEGIRVAWIGDGTNVCVSLAEACALLGLDFTCAAPTGYEPADPDHSRRRRPARGGRRRARLVTDVWVSMGQEDEREPRLAALADYCVDADLLSLADPTRSCSTACPRTPARRSPATSSTGRGARSGTRRRTGCTRRRPCSRSPSSEAHRQSRREQGCELPRDQTGRPGPRSRNHAQADVRWQQGAHEQARPSRVPGGGDEHDLVRLELPRRRGHRPRIARGRPRIAVREQRHVRASPCAPHQLRLRRPVPPPRPAGEEDGVGVPGDPLRCLQPSRTDRVEPLAAQARVAEHCDELASHDAGAGSAWRRAASRSP